MEKKTKITVITLLCVVCAAAIAVAGAFLIIGDPVVALNNAKLKSSVKEIESDTVRLNDVIPFEWDILYTFTPYSSKESIEETIGFKSSAIKENNVNEGMVHLLFVKGEKVVASVLGYGERLGYSIDFEERVTRAENALFSVTETNGITALKRIA